METIQLNRSSYLKKINQFNKDGDLEEESESAETNDSQRRETRKSFNMSIYEGIAAKKESTCIKYQGLIMKKEYKSVV